MASVEPSNAQIAQVIEFAGLDPWQDRDIVIQALKSNGGNAENVIMAYLEDPEGFRNRYTMTWDESMFEADRDGSKNNAGIAFHIESTSQNDGILSSQDNRLTAPSRPPSRSSNRSPLTRVADWVDTGPVGMRTHAQEEEDMQRALRESAQEAGFPAQEQETGVIDPQITMDAPQFGPATRSAYDASNWAMVQTEPAESNLSMIPLASKRKRADDIPAFLVQSTDAIPGNRIGAFLTILHSIPLARNKLLESGQPAASYWYNGEWWNGKDILAPEVLTRLQAGALDTDSFEAIPKFEEEIHRLAAFLDQTSRSYASADSLTRVITSPYMVTEYNGSGSVEKQFYEMFAGRNPDQVRPLYSKVTLESVLDNDDDSAEDNDDDEDPEKSASFGLLETEAAKDDLKHTKTLYEVMDHIMWGHALSDGIREDSKMAMYKEFGEILSFKLEGDWPEEGSMVIPEKLYPERWSEHRKPEARKIQVEWYRTKLGLQKLEEAKAKLETFPNPNGGEVRSKEEYLAQERSKWETYAKFLENRARFRALEESDFDINKYPDYKSAPCQMTEEDRKLQQECEEMMQSIDNSLKTLEKSKQKIATQIAQLQAQQRYLGQVLTDPKQDSERARPMACKEYLLRGIATSANVVYVCRRAPMDLIELDDNPLPRDQWWRLSLNAKAIEPVKAERLSFEQVHEQVWTDGRMPLIVYATEEAMDTLPLPLTQPLERFVKADNKAFNQEIALEVSSEAEDTSGGRRPTEPFSPSKRKHRSDSMDSMNSNRASIGSEDRNVGDPFIDEGISVEVITGVEPSQLSQDSASSNTMDMDMSQDDMAPLLPHERMEGVVESRRAEDLPTYQQVQSQEMEQRAGISPFMSASRTTGADSTSDPLNMDIPEN